MRQYTQPLPRALPTAPTLAQIMEVINSNSQRIQTLYTTTGTLSTPGASSIRASLAFQRAKNLRLRGDTALTGPEVDLGSNDQEFWFWIRRSQPPALYFCRHDRYASSAARQIIPVEPQWIIEALGVVTFDPTWQHSGPFSVGGGRVQVRSTPPPGSTLEPITRVLVIDESRGIVLEEHLYNSQGQRIATAKLSKHQHDPASQVTMPHKVGTRVAGDAFFADAGSARLANQSAGRRLAATLHAARMPWLSGRRSGRANGAGGRQPATSRRPAARHAKRSVGSGGQSALWLAASARSERRVSADSQSGPTSRRSRVSALCPRATSSRNRGRLCTANRLHHAAGLYITAQRRTAESGPGAVDRRAVLTTITTSRAS